MVKKHVIRGVAVRPSEVYVGKYWVRNSRRDVKRRSKGKKKRYVFIVFRNALMGITQGESLIPGCL